MEDAVTEELKLGVLMKDDVRLELDLLHQMSTSLLVFDMKRKQLDSHFDSLVSLIERQRDEAMKAIRLMEDEAEVAAEKRRKELRLREERLRVKIENDKKEVERRAAECVVKEKEMREAKMAAERMSVELCGKKKEVNVMKKAVDDLTAQVQAENARFNDTCQRLSDENLALRNEVKLLTQQLELKAQPLGREEQISEIFCNTMQHAELNGKVLFMHVREHIDDHEVATAKVSSVLLNVGDKSEDLILEALGISYSTELEEQGSQSIFRPCRILLLEQLCQICPQTKSQAREEALKVAVEWRAGVESCADKYSEISRFVRFLSMYDIASEFKDEVLLPMLHNVAVHEGTPDLCFTLGFADRITGYIKTLLKSSQLLKALEYVSAFKLARQFSVTKIVQEQMNQLKQTCQSMLKEGGHSQAAETQILDFQINTLKELIKCIKDLEVHGKYSAMNLEVRLVLVKLKRRRYIKKRPAPSPDHSSDPEPVKKKGCKPTGAAKSTEVEPKDTSNVYPESGSRDLCSSNLSSDSEPLNKKCFELPATPRSKDVPKDTLSANPESVSKDCCSNSSSNAEPVKNQTSELPETVATIDMSATEIEYPTLNVIDNVDEEEDHQGGPHSLFVTKRLKVEEDCNEEDSDVVLVNTNDGDVGRKRRNKAQSPFYASARKKSKRSSSRNMQVENIYGNRRPIDQSDAQKVETDQTTIKRGYCGKETILDSEGRIQCVIQGRFQTSAQTEKAVERARAFRAEEPVCIIALQPSYVCPQKKCHLHFPASFIEAYVNLKIKDVMLRTNDGRTWTLTYYLTESQHVSKLTSGWKKFAIDNDLKAGDVCLFELIKGAKNSLKVVVFRVTDEETDLHPKGHIHNLSETFSAFMTAFKQPRVS
ncbi:unnamed protein product [Rhodiola kirilowii]